VTGWLLDTNVLSELRKPRPETKVVGFISEQLIDNLYISSVTFAEIRYGIEMAQEAGRRAELHGWLTHFVRPMFEGRVLSVSEDVMLKWRLLMHEGRSVGHTFSQPDLIIGATALCHGRTIVSRNTRDFSRARVPMFNPWVDIPGRS